MILGYSFYVSGGGCLHVLQGEKALFNLASDLCILSHVIFILSSEVINSLMLMMILILQSGKLSFTVQYFLPSDNRQ